MKACKYEIMERFVHRRQSGIAIVEFAIGVLVLLFLLLVAAEVGRALYSYNTLTKAVRGGGRYISDHSTLPTGAVVISAAEEANTQNMVVYGDVGGSGNPVLPYLAPGDVTVERTFPSAGALTYVRVRAIYGYQSIFGSLRLPGFDEVDLAFNMVATSTMRVVR